MKGITWNVRSYTQAKHDSVLSLVRSSDLNCLTETWSPIQTTENWNPVSTAAPLHEGASRRRGKVSVLYRRGRSFKLIGEYSESFHMIHGVINGIPILGTYLTPRIKHGDLDRAVYIAASCLRGPGVLLGHFNAKHRQWDNS